LVQFNEKDKEKNCEHRYICTLGTNFYVKLQCKYCNEICEEREGDAGFFDYMMWLTNREEIKRFFANPDNKFKTWTPLTKFGTV